MLAVALLGCAFASPLLHPLTSFQHVRAVTRLQQQETLEHEALLASMLDDRKVDALFGWISRAFAGDERYNNLMLAFAALFGDDPRLRVLVDGALAKLPAEDVPVGEAPSLRERERSSLGAMGAGQWTGQFRTRPHALLDVRHLNDVDEWASSLSRGARRTLNKAAEQNFSVVARPIRGDEPAPHSTLAHFRCVVAHEVRLLATTPEELLDALSQAIGRVTFFSAGRTRGLLLSPWPCRLALTVATSLLCCAVHRLHWPGGRDSRISRR